ncbi:lipopolysaccharide biosynthesis protein [Proteiniphilum sp.]|uniref:lipopolysaccharide biosynthesis protein n=1 Tax=Proteiniphilum sp. TaxID=1926877 RepID=UPI00331EC84A
MAKTLKEKSISALIWSTFDKVFCQITYAISGIILANKLFPEDFGVIMIITVFSAFITIFVDSGFNVALIQHKETTDRDYQSVFSFNLAISILLYTLLFFLAPAISHYYDDIRLIPLSRVMFLTVIIQAFGLVQSSILMREMKMKAVALANMIPLLISGGTAIVLALIGLGIWTLVIQALVLASTRTLFLWIQNSWRPTFIFDWASLKKMYTTGKNIFLTSFTNTIFQSLYPLIIGSRYSLHQLGYYAQADKWSRMGYISLLQAFGQFLLPSLSSIQDDKERMKRVFGKTNRMAAYFIIPFFAALIVAAEPIFHIFFGTKWDSSIPLFQILLVKGIFFVLVTLQNNYLIARGKTRIVFYIELVKNAIILIAIFVTVGISIPALVIGQAVAAIIQYFIGIFVTARGTGYDVKRQLLDILPYMVISTAMCCLLMVFPMIIKNDFLMLGTQIGVGGLFYFTVNKALHSTIQQDVVQLVKDRMKNSFTR